MSEQGFWKEERGWIHLDTPGLLEELTPKVIDIMNTMMLCANEAGMRGTRTRGLKLEGENLEWKEVKKYKEYDDLMRKALAEGNVSAFDELILKYAREERGE